MVHLSTTPSDRKRLRLHSEQSSIVRSAQTGNPQLRQVTFGLKLRARKGRVLNTGIHLSVQALEHIEEIQARRFTHAFIVFFFSNA